MKKASPLLGVFNSSTPEEVQNTIENIAEEIWDIKYKLEEAKKRYKSFVKTWETKGDNEEVFGILGFIESLCKVLTTTTFNIIAVVGIAVITYQMHILSLDHPVVQFLAVITLALALNFAAQCVLNITCYAAIRLRLRSNIRKLSSDIRFREQLIENYKISRLQPKEIVDKAQSSILPKLSNDIYGLKSKSSSILNEEIRKEFETGLDLAIQIIYLCERNNILVSELTSISASFNVGIEKLYELIKSVDSQYDTDADVLKTTKQFTKFMGNKLSEFELLISTNKDATVKALSNMFET